MKLNIGQSIRRLRQERNVTQEELASAIGVTAQAVSKWERAEGYPDITLLPDIAAFFGVSLDNVCGLDEQKNREEIRGIRNASMAAGTYDESVRIAREGLEKYPHSDLLKETLACALTGCLAGRTPPGETLDEIIRLYEDVLDHSTDQDLRNTAAAAVCQIYELAGNHEKAIETAGSLASHDNTAEMILTRILHGKELIQHVQNTIIQTIPRMDFMLRQAMRENCYSPEEKIILHRKIIGMYDLVNECHDWPVGMMFAIQHDRFIAEIQMSLYDLAGCLESLRDAARRAVRYDSLVFEGKPESLLLNQIEYKYLSGAQTARKELREELEGNAVYDCIRNTPEYRAIVAELTK